MALAIQHGSPPANRTTVPHGPKPGVPLDPVKGVKILGALPRKILNMLPRQWILDTPVRARVLGDPGRLIRPQLMVRAPDVVVELAELNAVPMEAVEIDIRAALADLGQELLQPANSMRRGRDAGASRTHACLSQGLDAPQPLGGGEVYRHVGLVRELGLVEAEDGWGAGAAGVLVQLVDVDVVPLHRDELERAVRCWAGGPVVEP